MKQSSSKYILLSAIIGLLNLLWTIILNTVLIIEVMEEVKLRNKKGKNALSLQDILVVAIKKE